VRGAQLVLYNRPALHHELDMLQQGDVIEWVALHGNQVGKLSCLNRIL
jgi:hypothetical protein